MAFAPFRLPPPGQARDRVLLGCGMVALLGATIALTLALAPAPVPRRPTSPAPEPVATVPAAPPAMPSSPAAPPTPGLPVIDYNPAPIGFPTDRAPESTEPLTDGLRPLRQLGAYDAPGGQPRAYLPPDILGAPLTMPIVARRSGWVAVLLPSANRTVAWVPPNGWARVPLRDQLVVERRRHRLTWLRDNDPVRSWPVDLGHSSSPTPLGRTFIVARTALAGAVYADSDVFALGAVPDDPDAVPTQLRGSHIGLHAWYDDDDLGGDTTDGSIRLPRSGQRELLDELAPGTSLVVIDGDDAPEPPDESPEPPNESPEPPHGSLAPPRESPEPSEDSASPSR